VQRFFSFFYASINAGSLLSTVLTPAVQASAGYAAAFALPAALMAGALVALVRRSIAEYMLQTQGFDGLFSDTNIHFLTPVSTCILFQVAGRRTYTIALPQGDLFTKTLAVLASASSARCLQGYTAVLGVIRGKVRANPVDFDLSPLGSPPSLSRVEASQEIVARSCWDAAVAAHGDAFVNDVRQLSKVMVLFAPAPVFWCLFDQQVHRVPCAI